MSWLLLVVGAAVAADGSWTDVDGGTATGIGGGAVAVLFAALWVLERLGYLKRPGQTTEDTAPRSPSRTTIVRELKQDERNERVDRLLEATARVDWQALAQVPAKLDEVLERLDELQDVGD